MEILFIRRAERESDPWSGHMAFPGGRFEPNDCNLHETAVRETREEIGLDLAVAGRLLGRIDDVTTFSHAKPVGLIVTPFVFSVNEAPEFSPNEEVAEVLWAPLGPLARRERDTTRPYRLRGQEVDLPAFDVDGRVVWGLTYLMISALFRRLGIVVG